MQDFVRLEYHRGNTKDIPYINDCAYFDWNIDDNIYIKYTSNDNKSCCIWLDDVKYISCTIFHEGQECEKEIL